MGQYDWDLFVIGAGSAGVRVARKSAALGKKVAIAEMAHWGGTCVNLGCIPKKLFVYASEFPKMAQYSAHFGVELAVQGIYWSVLVANKNKEIERLHGVYEQMMTKAGVTLIQGFASVTEPHQVAVNGQHYRAEKIVIATGGVPWRPVFPGAEYTVTSDDMFHLKTLPKRVLVIGSGYIAVEFAGILNGLGVNTWLAYRSEQVLKDFDTDVRLLVGQQMAKKGVRLLPQHQIRAVRLLPSSAYVVEFEQGEAVEVDLVLMCTGRVARLEGLGLEALGIQVDASGLIPVNEQYQTCVKSIYALGDITAGPALTPVAIAEAMTFVAQQYLGDAKPLDYGNIATAVFSQPPVATVGMAEVQARKVLGNKIACYKTEFTPLKHRLSGVAERVLMKLIVRTDNDLVIGAHMVGDEAGEIMQGVAIAMKAGATKADFDATIGIHPTVAEEFTTLG